MNKFVFKEQSFWFIYSYEKAELKICYENKFLFEFLITEVAYKKLPIVKPIQNILVI